MHLSAHSCFQSTVLIYCWLCECELYLKCSRVIFLCNYIIWVIYSFSYAVELYQLLTTQGETVNLRRGHESIWLKMVLFHVLLPEGFQQAYHLLLHHFSGVDSLSSLLVHLHQHQEYHCNFPHCSWNILNSLPSQPQLQHSCSVLFFKVIKPLLFWNITAYKFPVPVFANIFLQIFWVVHGVQ